MHIFNSNMELFPFKNHDPPILNHCQLLRPFYHAEVKLKNKKLKKGKIEDYYLKGNKYISQLCNFNLTCVQCNI